jgi:GNAT superfamily N-acetyltransferase
MIVLPLDEADHEAVLNFLLPELVSNGALIADCTTLRGESRAFVAEKAGQVLGVMAQIGLCVGVRATSENAFRKLLAAHGGAIATGTRWSMVPAAELGYIESQATIEWTEPMFEMLYDPIAGPVEPAAPAGLARKLTVNDLGALRRLFEEVGVRHFEPAMLQRGPFYGIVGEEAPAQGAQLVAVAGSYYVTDWLGELGLVHVLPKSRRRGYGTLVSHLVTQEILGRAKKACLHVAKNDRGPHELYLKMGYRDVGEAHLVVWQV